MRSPRFRMFVILGVWAASGPHAGILVDALFRIGSLVFGGGHVVLPLLVSQMATTGIVSPARILTGYAAAQADPNLAEPHALLGRLFASKRQLPAAVKEYHEALRLRPDFGRIRLDLASVLAAQGDMRQAIQQLREAVKSGDPEVARLAAEALQRLGER